MTPIDCHPVFGFRHINSDEFLSQDLSTEACSQDIEKTSHQTFEVKTVPGLPCTAELPDSTLETSWRWIWPSPLWSTFLKKLVRPSCCCVCIFSKVASMLNSHTSHGFHVRIEIATAHTTSKSTYNMPRYNCYGDSHFITSRTIMKHRQSNGLARNWYKSRLTISSCNNSIPRYMNPISVCRSEILIKPSKDTSIET